MKLDYEGTRMRRSQATPKSSTNTMARAMHDLGLATWFGGSLMGAVALNGAAAGIDDDTQRAAVAADGWGHWAPINAVAILAHLAGASVMGKESAGRVVTQQGMLSVSVTKVALTVAAVAVSAWSGVEGARVRRHGQESVAGVTEPRPDTAKNLAAAQSRLRVLQWAVPVLTGGVALAGARLEELWRPAQITKGVAARLIPGA